MSVNTEQSVCVKEEPEPEGSWDCSLSVKQEDERYELYSGHAVKGELVLGPECLQTQDLAFALARRRAPGERSQDLHPGLAHDSDDGLESDLVSDNEALVQSGIDTSVLLGAPNYTALECSGSTGRPHLNDSCMEQLVFQVCYVKLERMFDPGQALPHKTSNKTFAQNSNFITNLEEVNDFDTKEDIYSCDICRNNMPKPYLIEHMQTHMDLRSPRHICKDLFKVTHNPPENWGHNPQQPVLKSCNVLLERLCIEKKLYACNSCHKVFGHQSSLISHLHSHAKVPPRLPNQRPVGDRNNVKSYVCDTCNKECTRKADLIMHIRVHTGEKPFSCHVCKKRFAISGNLHKHMTIHTGQKFYTCDICHRGFTLKSNLQKHVSLHSGHKPYSCKICGKLFAQRCYLINHVRFHMKDKSFFRYSCDICGKKMVYISELKIHRRCHTGDKPFSCDICKKRFSRSGDVTRHRRLHSGIRPHVCATCGSTFAQKNTLTAHEQTHTGIKPYFCIICGKRFATATSLQRHKLVHTRDKPYSYETWNK